MTQPVSTVLEDSRFFNLVELLQAQSSLTEATEVDGVVMNAYVIK